MGFGKKMAEAKQEPPAKKPQTFQSTLNWLQLPAKCHRKFNAVVHVLSAANGKAESITEAEKLNLKDNHFCYTLPGELYKDKDNSKTNANFSKGPFAVLLNCVSIYLAVTLI